MSPILLLLACAGNSTDPKQTEDLGPPPLPADVVQRVDPHLMKGHIDVIADDAYGGRIPGSHGSAMARDYILGQMQEIGLEPVGVDPSYTWEYPNEPSSSFFMLDESGAVVPHATVTGTNLIGAIPGTDPILADEVIVVMAHYDHLGVDESGDAFNGAFDNAAAVAMNLEIARALIDSGNAFERTVVFMFTDDEEFGLDGADEWIKDPSVPQENVVYGVSTDPLGRAMLPDFAPIVLAGLERTPELEAVWREAARFVDAPIYFQNRDVIKYFASDQDPFWEQDTPAVWFTNIGFTWYHTVDDTPETIDYRILLRDAELLMYVLALTGDTDQRYPYLGPQEPGPDAARAARGLLLDAMQSEFPDVGDRRQADFLTEQLDEVIAANDASVLENQEAVFTAGLYFLLFDLPEKYPGEVPPPWPEGR